MDYLVLGVQAYSIPDETTGKPIEGISIYYIDLEDRYALDRSNIEEAKGGIFPGKLTAELNDLRYFSVLPGIYDIQTKIKRTSKATVSKFISAKYQEHKKIELTGVPEDTPTNLIMDAVRKGAPATVQAAQASMNSIKPVVKS